MREAAGGSGRRRLGGYEAPAAATLLELEGQVKTAMVGRSDRSVHTVCGRVVCEERVCDGTYTLYEAQNTHILPISLLIWGNPPVCLRSVPLC